MGNEFWWGMFYGVILSLALYGLLGMWLFI
jgi:hypothetical protein